MYYGARITKGGKPRTIYFKATRIHVESGDLLLFMEHEGRERLYRALSRGTWTDVFEASGFDGDEMYEERDIDETTGKDARNPHNVKNCQPS